MGYLSSYQSVVSLISQTYLGLFFLIQNVVYVVRVCSLSPRCISFFLLFLASDFCWFCLLCVRMSQTLHTDLGVY
jgi:hypothetical protein